jgi:hypothetical protein
MSVKENHHYKTRQSRIKNEDEPTQIMKNKGY